MCHSLRRVRSPRSTNRMRYCLCVFLSMFQEFDQNPYLFIWGSRIYFCRFCLIDSVVVSFDRITKNFKLTNWVIGIINSAFF